MLPVVVIMPSIGSDVFLPMCHCALNYVNRDWGIHRGVLFCDVLLEFDI
jgi:hypothetical protein